MGNLVTPNGKLIDSYYNKYDESKRYQEILLRAGYPTQANEINEMQSILFERLKRVADGIYSDGDTIADAQIVVNESTGETQAQAGAIYIGGAVWPVEAASFTIPTEGTIAVGIRLVETIISELEDPDLYNPAIGSRSEGEPGAWRRKIVAQWGYDGDGGPGDFYPVHMVDDGVVRAKEAPPAFDAITQSIARYDRDSTGGGTYVCAGMFVDVAEDTEDGRQVYTVTEGRARVDGFGVDMLTSRRLVYDAEPDLRFVDTEVIEADGTPSQRIRVAHAPIYNITALHVPVQVTETLTHGNFSGCADPLQHSGVLKIVSVTMGSTTYNEGTDFVRTGDTVDWSPKGAEMSTGSTYTVTYNYLDRSREPEDVDFDGFTVTGAVAGHSIMVSYNQALPRFDRLCLSSDGLFSWVQGVPAEYNAKAPNVPAGLLSLATVHQTWRTLLERRVDSNGTRVVPFADYMLLANRVDFVLMEVARTRLETDGATREAGNRVGMFVDPLLDDSMRDQGLEQTAAIIGEALTLPVNAEIHNFDADIVVPQARGYSSYVVLEQPLRTGEMKVNPYQAFEPMPSSMTLSPAVDRWTETTTEWASTITKTVKKTTYAPGHPQHGITLTSTKEKTEDLGTTSTAIASLRQISVSFSAKNFGAGERLKSVTFDGIAVAASGSGVANDAGVMSGSFTIPAGVPAGSKEVVVTGVGGTRAQAVFVGQGTLETTTLRTVKTVTKNYIDPLAQTFVPNTDMAITGADLYFTAKGPGRVKVQIRQTSNGYPAQTILAETELEAAQITVGGGGHTRAMFDAPVPVLANTEYALVILTDDAETAVAVAEIGKYDSQQQKWVSSQPYSIGVLFSSSNASAWTAHQERDLTFRLLAARYDAGDTSVNLGQTATVSGVTDLLLYAVAETPTAGCRVEYLLTLPNGQTMTVAEDQPIQLPTPVTGKIGVTARLSGDASGSPVLWPGTQLVCGRLGGEGTYLTRSIKASGANRVFLVYDAYLPAGSGITVELQKDSGVWEPLPQTKTVQQGEGIVEFTHATEINNIDLAKVKLTLSGTAQARPFVWDIRFLAIA